MLKAKKKVCRGCKLNTFIWSGGRCLACVTRTVSDGTQKEPTKYPLKRLPLQSKAKLKSKRKGKPKVVRDFYAKMTKDYEGGYHSFESGRAISNVSAVNMAHIFPKERYKSLAVNPLNIIILTWEEHTDFDSLLLKHDFSKLEAKFENSWVNICERVIKLLPLCEENGKLKSALIKYLNYEATEQLQN